MAGLVNELPSLDDDIDTMIDGHLGAFQDGTGVQNTGGTGDEKGTDNDGETGNDGEMNELGGAKRPTREELKMRLKQKRMFYGGRRMTKSAQQLRLDDAKKRYTERQKRAEAEEQAKVIGSNTERNRRLRAKKNAKRKAKKEALKKVQNAQDGENA